MYMFVCLLSLFVCLYVRIIIINILSLSLTLIASTNDDDDDDDDDNNNSDDEDDDDDDDDIFNNRS